MTVAHTTKHQICTCNPANCIPTILGQYHAVLYLFVCLLSSVFLYVLIKSFTSCSQRNTEKIGPALDKTSKMTCVPIEDSDQPGHPPSLIRVFAVHSKDSQGFFMCTAKTLIRLGGCPCRLIPVFTGCTDHFVGFVVHRLK